MQVHSVCLVWRSFVSTAKVIEMVEEGTPWPDRLIELQLWCRIAILSNKFNDTESLRMAYSRAIDSVSYFEKKKLENKWVQTKKQIRKTNWDTLEQVKIHMYRWMRKKF